VGSVVESSLRIGFSTEIAGLTVSEAVDCCVHAESLGYDDVWSSESGGWDGVSPLAAVSAKTRRVRLGTAILPIAYRAPALTAMTARTMQDISGGRFVLGLGTSTRAIV
jgi:alkanesulfonate monooxygenase SsuD/methylene tetrahydromethanopterin reductase-like flavin-dependent oxidoreductase (luciferase family)